MSEKFQNNYRVNQELNAGEAYRFPFKKARIRKACNKMKETIRISVNESINLIESNDQSKHNQSGHIINQKFIA